MKQLKKGRLDSYMAYCQYRCGIYAPYTKQKSILAKKAAYDCFYIFDIVFISRDDYFYILFFAKVLNISINGGLKLLQFV